MPEDRIDDAAVRSHRAGLPSAQPAGDSPLLTAKLTAAPVPGSAIARPRLSRLLDAGATGPVTLVSAPAGWGKTLLLSSWQRAATGAAPGWLTLAPPDVGARLWAYVAAALPGPATDLPSASPDPAAAGGPAGATAGSPTGGAAGPEREGVAVFLDHLADSIARRPEPAVLILDDVDQVGDPALLDGLDFLLRHTADRLRLVLGTRSDPVHALHRWRLRGELAEIRSAELAFTPEETAELLAAQGVPVPAQQAHELWRRTEGWPAGLRLAALGLREHPDPARYVTEFAGDDPGVAGYLGQEVLAGLPVRVRDGLRTAAVSDRMSGALLDALTGETGGERLLAEAEQTGFVRSLGTRPPTWRCHRLLGDLLRDELRHRPAEELSELHRRAADWQAAHDLPGDALGHALVAGDWARSVDILLDHWPALLPAGSAGPALPEVAAPPPETVRAEPEVALAFAADRLRRDDLGAARTALSLAVDRATGLPGDRRVRFDLILAALRLAEARLGGDQPAIAAAATELLSLANRNPPARSGPPTPARPGPPTPAPGSLGPTTAGLAGAGPTAAAPGSPGPAAAGPGGTTAAQESLGGRPRPPGQLPAASARAVARTALGMIRLGRGELAAAEGELAEGSAEAARVGLARTQLAAAGRLALVLAVRGRLGLADQTARGALELPACRDLFGPADCAPAHLALALVAAERDRLDDAQTHLTLAAGSTDKVGEPVIAALAEVLRGQLRRARGDLAGGLQALLAGRRRLAGHAVPPLVEQLLLAAEADLRALHGEVDPARALLTRAMDRAGPTAVPLAVALARVQLLAGDAQAAARTLPEWDGPDTADLPLSVRLEAGLLDALAARSAGDGRRAGRTLERVLELADPEGYRRIFVRARLPVRELLADHLESGTAHWPLLTELIEVNPPVPAPSPAANGPGEPLTERELTVLRYLQSILSNVEIASEMSLSVNTVKTHVRNIYRKLDATRRREAVRRARELHLI